ncbi:hypothetical protein ACFPYI_13780 [Halomarina salina]|uniref:Restriction endonuclease n=1 Tax=Halomarina salina TaxID=1872699 RepID=A0ABD5RPQ0_9EURY|nr:hypothetical protein [Halomarina salina]
MSASEETGVWFTPLDEDLIDEASETREQACESALVSASRSSSTKAQHATTGRIAELVYARYLEERGIPFEEVQMNHGSDVIQGTGAKVEIKGRNLDDYAFEDWAVGRKRDLLPRLRNGVESDIFVQINFSIEGGWAQVEGMAHRGMVDDAMWLRSPEDCEGGKHGDDTPTKVIDVDDLLGVPLPGDER